MARVNANETELCHPGNTCPSTSHLRRWAELRREYRCCRGCQGTRSRSFPTGWQESPQLTTERGTLVSESVLDETEDIEEFPLLLQSRDVRDLIDAARQEGLTAAGLARRLIRDYLHHVRSTRPVRYCSVRTSHS
jgi:hypothetical protein